MKLVLCIVMMWCCITATGQRTIKQQIHVIQDKYHVHFVYDAKLNLDIQSSKELASNETLKEALKILFDGSNISYKIRGRNILLRSEKISVTKYSVRGRVTEQNGEPVINATIYDMTTGQGTLSNEKGYYIIYLTAGTHQLRASCVGNKEESHTFDLNQNRVHNFILENNIALSEVVVHGNKSATMLSTQTGKRTFTAADINTEFSLLSSPDLIKTLQHTSGVNGGVELASGLYVHGGNGDENLFLLDGSPLYQTNHSFGLFSAFNSDIIKNVDFYKSGFPARYSGRISSITDVRTRDGNMEKVQGTFSIGLLDGRIQVEGPIWKNRTSFNVALRRSWIDLLMKPTFALLNSQKEDGEKYTFGYAFHDFNAKITHRLNQDNCIWMSVYSGNDNYSIRDKSSWSGYVTDANNKFNWGNLNFTLGGDFMISPVLNTTVAAIGSYSHSLHNSEEDDTYHYDNVIRRNSLDLRTNKTKMMDMGGKIDFRWSPVASQRIRFGGSYTHHSFRPQTTQQSFYFGDPSEKVDTTRVEATCNTSSDEISAYLEDEMSLTTKLSANIGCSYTLTKVEGRTYHLLDPRLALKYQATDKLSFKASYTHMSQSIHRIASTFLELPTDFWVPTTQDIQPTQSHQFVSGIYTQLNNQLSLSVEGFYKSSTHLLQYRNWMGLQPPAANWNKNVTDGRGRAYGLELDGAYQGKRFSTTLAYTLLWSKRNFPELHDAWFADQFDNRHKIDITSRYQITDRISVFAAWTLHSGNRITLPVASISQPQLPGDNVSGDMEYLYNEPNNFRLPAYHRLDVGADFKSTTKKGNERIWNISIYNAYCHLNTMYTKVHKNEDGSFSAKCKGYIPIIPSVSYTIKF